MLVKILIITGGLIFLYLVLNLCAALCLRKANLLHKLPGKDLRIYLTFDDGIDSKFTPRLLDLLDKYQIKAGFFILADTIDENAEIFCRMYASGHTVGLHCWKHRNLLVQDPFSTARDFRRSVKAFEARGISPVFYRPTWGLISLMGLCLCRRYKLKITLWNVIVQDWRADTTPRIICDKLTRQVKRNAVVCLHDGRGKNNAPEKTIDALEIMIPKWIEEGYEFKTIAQLHEEGNA